MAALEAEKYLAELEDAEETGPEKEEAKESGAEKGVTDAAPEYRSNPLL